MGWGLTGEWVGRVPTGNDMGHADFLYPGDDPVSKPAAFLAGRDNRGGGGAGAARPATIRGRI